MTKKREATELVPIDKQFPVLAQDTFELAELLEENLGGRGIDRFELERLKVAAGGAPGYVIEQGEDEIDTIKEFDAIVVHQHASRTFYKGGNSEDNVGGPPDCKSDDGVVGHGDNGTQGKTHQCENCHQAQWESDPKGGRGQACKLQQSVYFYRQENDSVFPSMLLVPPTSLKNWRSYVVGLVSKGVKLSQALHHFSTTGGHQNPAGQKYTKIAVRFARKLDAEESEKIAGLAESIKGLVSVSRTPQDAKKSVDYGDIPL